MMHYKFHQNDGPLITFLHGLGEDHSIFNKQVSHLKNHGYSTLTVDLLGHGRSSLINGKASISQQVKSLEEVLEKEGIKKNHLAGFSLGSAIALDYARQNEEKVEKIIVINPGFYHQDYLCLKIKLLSPVLKGLGLLSKLDQGFRRNNVDLSDTKWSHAYYSFPRSLKRTNLNGLYANIKAFIEHGVPNEKYLSEIKQHTLIIASFGGDELLKEEISFYLEQKIHKTLLVRIDGNHVLMVDKKDKVNNILLDYLSLDQ